MVKDFLVSSALDLILLLFPNTCGPHSDRYKRSLAKLQEFLKVQEIYQNIQIYPYDRPQGQPTALRLYVIDAPLNLIGRDLLMQGQTQIYIPHFS